ncbi:MAG: hypothetical protein OHK0039_38330 [Bacteroidia bacterium]
MYVPARPFTVSIYIKTPMISPFLPKNDKDTEFSIQDICLPRSAWHDFRKYLVMRKGEGSRPVEWFDALATHLGDAEAAAQALEAQQIRTDSRHTWTSYLLRELEDFLAYRFLSEDDLQLRRYQTFAMLRQATPNRFLSMLRKTYKYLDHEQPIRDHTYYRLRCNLYAMEAELGIFNPNKNFRNYTPTPDEQVHTHNQIAYSLEIAEKALILLYKGQPLTPLQEAARTQLEGYRQQTPVIDFTCALFDILLTPPMLNPRQARQRIGQFLDHTSAWRYDMRVNILHILLNLLLKAYRRESSLDFIDLRLHLMTFGQKASMLIDHEAHYYNLIRDTYWLIEHYLAQPDADESDEIQRSIAELQQRIEETHRIFRPKLPKSQLRDFVFAQIHRFTYGDFLAVVRSEVPNETGDYAYQTDSLWLLIKAIYELRHTLDPETEGFSNLIVNLIDRLHRNESTHLRFGGHYAEALIQTAKILRSLYEKPDKAREHLKKIAASTRCADRNWLQRKAQELL